MCSGSWTETIIQTRNPRLLWGPLWGSDVSIHPCELPLYTAWQLPATYSHPYRHLEYLTLQQPTHLRHQGAPAFCNLRGLEWKRQLIPSCVWLVVRGRCLGFFPSCSDQELPRASVSVCPAQDLWQGQGIPGVVFVQWTQRGPRVSIHCCFLFPRH